MRLAILRLETLKANEALFIDEDIEVFEKAGNELSSLAIEFPSKYLNTLQQLRWIIDGSQRNTQTFVEAQKGLLMAMPKSDDNPSKTASPVNEINQLLLKELDIHDR
jgi:hypothetical protein